MLASFIIPAALLPLLAGASKLSPARVPYEKSSSLSVTVQGSPTQCGESTVVITGGTTPFSISINPASGGTSLEILPPTDQEGVFTWTVDIAGGQAVVMQVDDVAGNTASSPTLNIGTSSDRSCLPGGSSDIGGQDSIFQWQSSVAAAVSPTSSGSGSSPTSGSGSSSSIDSGSSGSSASSASGGVSSSSAPTGTPTSVSETGSSMSTTYVYATATPSASPESGAAVSSRSVSLAAGLCGALAFFL